MNWIVLLGLILCAFVIMSSAQHRNGETFSVKPLAYDRFAPTVGNPREPHELLIAEEVSSYQTSGKLMRIVIFPETNGRRGGAKPIDEGAFSRLQKWTFTGRIATKEEMSTVCTANNYFRSVDGSIDVNEKGDPTLRFKSFKYDIYNVFENINLTRCVVAYSMPASAQ